jgi:hypothetical protein
MHSLLPTQQLGSETVLGVFVARAHEQAQTSFRMRGRMRQCADKDTAAMMGIQEQECKTLGIGKHLHLWPTPSLHDQNSLWVCVHLSSAAMDRIVRTALDFIGLSSSPSKPSPKPSPKRPASSVLRGQAKRVRHFEDIPASVYQNARYEGAATVTMTESEDGEVYSYASHISSGPRVKLTPKGMQTKTKTPKTATPAELARQLRDLRKENAALRKGDPAIQVETIGETPTRTMTTAKKLKRATLSRETGDLPPEYDAYSTKKKWKLHSIFRARELNDPKKFRAEVQGPEYALRDAEIRDGMRQIMDQMETFTKAYFGHTEGVKVGNEDGVVPTDFYKKLSPETAKVIGCVASGGPSGIYGWHNLFIDEQKRRALVMAIIGNVLTEQVFQHLLFGGTDSQIATMIKLGEKYEDSDGTPIYPSLPLS